MGTRKIIIITAGIGYNMTEEVQADNVPIVDLFSGPGGLSRGMENAGFVTVSGIDHSEPAVETFNNNHKYSVLEGDIIETDTKEILDHAEKNGFEKLEIAGVVGGPPCKGFSLANMQTRSPDNPMNDLFLHFIKTVSDISPFFFIMENVPGLLSMSREEGEVKDVILKQFREIGYNITHKILKAEQFGVPQARRRVFFIGVKKGTPPFPTPTYKAKRNQATIHSAIEGGKTPVTVGEAIMDLPELPKGGGGEEKMGYTDPPHSRYAEEMRENADDTLWNHKTTVNKDRTVKRFEHIPQGGNWEDIPEELMKNYTDRSRTHGHIYYRLKEDEPALTVANFRKSMMVHPTQDRLLSVREAARLQSFPDDFIFYSSRISDKQQMVGDAVPVKLAEAIGSKMTEFLEDNSYGPKQKN